MSAQGDGGNERRRGTRHLACFPVQERVHDNKPLTGMIRELSVVGAQILTQAHREVGTDLTLSLYLDEERPPRDVEARVVRSERRTDRGVWSWLTVVEFKEPLSDLETEIKAVAEAQERVFGPSSSRIKAT